MPVETLIWLIPIPPLVAFVVIALLTFRWRALSHGLAIGGAGISWLLSMLVFIRAAGASDLQEKPFTSAFNWLPTGNTWLPIGVQIDPLSAVVLFFVAWTVLMIFIYSVGYHNYGQPDGDHDRPGLPPHGANVQEHGTTHRVPSIEPMYARFFAFISLFAFAMYALVVTDNLLTLYVAWEIMGLCSYLLIGFWYGKATARDAAVKAFLTTRVGDMFMMLGMVALYTVTGSLNYRAILANPAVLEKLASAVSPVAGLSWAGLIGLLIFIGTVGKSAQFPLHVWLPDAMEGPTPVSAMIHAATMVSAGVYLAIRFFPLVSAGWEPGMPLNTVMTVIAITGAFTALFAATIAVAQNDIKRVLAYSTISQLGYMIAALGVGAYTAAAFHLVTHAFFKALLFLGSGSVIHGMEHGLLHSGDKSDPQDMLNMGGLRIKMPATFWTFLLGGLALSGFPLLTSGFWSKDEILTGVFKSGQTALFIMLALAALLTAFYTMRQITLTFLGEPRSKSSTHAVETGKVMTIPLAVLAFFAVTAGWVGIPHGFPGLGGIVPNWFEEFLGHTLSEAGVGRQSPIPLITSLVVSLGGLLLGWLVYRGYKAGEVDPLHKALGPVYTLLKRKYYVDELYQFILVKPAYWISETFTAVWVDKKLIDGILHGIAQLGLALGKALKDGVDQPVINGAGNGLGRGLSGMGFGMRRFQSGKVQQYMLYALGGVILAGILLYLFMAQA